MRSVPRASLSEMPIAGNMPAKGQAHRPEIRPAPAPPPDEGADVVRLPPARGGILSTNLRLPVELHRAFKVASLEDGRPVNGLIVEAMEQYIARRRGRA